MSFWSAVALGAFWVSFVAVPPALAALAGAHFRNAKIAAAVGGASILAAMGALGLFIVVTEATPAQLLLGTGVIILLSGPAVVSVVAVIASRNIER